MYQRPMLEDGEIEFETWYEPGVFEVHPALGRSAFLLKPDGIQLHRLTDGEYESGGLKPDNQQSIPGAASSLTLKPKDWNQIRLSLRGDDLTVSVNGQEAATIKIIEAPNARHFGLFRYSNLTQTRVRKLVYRGQWPKELPPLESQLLAAAADGPQLANAQVMLDADLTLSDEELGKLNLILRGPADRRESSSQGLHLHLHDSKGGSDNPGIAYSQPIEANCEVTVTYEGVQISPHKSGWGVSLVLEFALDDPQKTRAECNLSLDKGQQLQHTTQLLRNHAANSHHSLDAQFFHPGNVSGKLRMIRRGGQVDCYAAADGSDEYVHLNSLAVGSARILTIACSAKCSDDVAKLDVTLQKLTIRQGNTQ